MGKLLIATASLLLAVSTAANAKSSEGCILDLRKLTSHIDDSAGFIKTLQSPKTEKRNLTHIVELSSGVKVEFSVGGCVHYGFSYTFSQLKEMPTEKGKLFDFIRGQLRLLPLKDGKADSLERMVDVLQKASAVPENWQAPTELFSPFGDASAFLSLKKGAFVISYDFPL